MNHTKPQINNLIRRKPIHRLALSKWYLIIALHCCTNAWAQTYTATPDLGHVKTQVKEKLEHPLQINGGLSLNAIYVNNTGVGTTTPQPFTWMGTGNINIKLLGYAIPLTFNYSSQQVQYTSPSFKFNRFSLNPKYKEWVVHIGTISSSFSPYTLSGFQYNGLGVDYAKDKWQVQTVYGTFLPAIAEDSTITPSYKRIGWGTKVAFVEKNKKISVSLFHAKDNPNSIPAPIKEANSSVTPMEGTAFALEGIYPVAEHLTLNMEYSTSVLTRNVLLSNNPLATVPTSLFTKTVSKPNGSTAIYHAIKTGINYAFEQSTLGVTYERVDPGYQTLGGYFFTNDFENIALTTSQSFWKGKITSQLNLGLQKDNLNNLKQSGMRRMTIAGNANIHPSEKWNIGFTYSNMQAYTVIKTGFEQINQVTPYQTFDTLNFTQLSQNATVNISYNITQSKEKTQSISLAGNYVETANKKGDIIRLGDATRFFNGNISHLLALPTKNCTITSSFNFSYNYAAQIGGNTVGLMTNIAQLFFKKAVRTNCGIAYNVSSSLNNHINIMNIRAGISTAIAKKHNLNMNITWQHKTGNNVATTTYCTTTLGYAYSF